MTGNSTIRRARLLVALSAFAPPVVIDVYGVWSRVRENEFGTADMTQLGGFTILLWLLGLVMVLTTRKRPHMWLYPGYYVGAFLVVGLVFQAYQSSSYHDDQAIYWASTIATIVAIAAVTVLPASRARRMVLTNPSPEIVESDLELTFTSRGDRSVSLSVDPTEISAYEDSKRDDRVRVSVPLTDVTTVTTWHQPESTEWEVPGGGTLSLPAGELIGIDVPDGRLVLAVADPANAKRFVDARVALARQRAAVTDS
ncbi:MAG: hypothetical protein WBA97_02350 [Actinophytocola sp.]|uniref:hypothetical protein n=1 Tax=Actinophytocola sp. TaxID=1872138 RepID=UPI003C752210